MYKRQELTMVGKMMKYIELNFVKVVNLLIKLIRVTKSEFGWEEKQRLTIEEMKKSVYLIYNKC